MSVAGLLFGLFVIVLLNCGLVCGQYEEVRCKCVCSVKSGERNSTQNVWIASVPDCTCENVINPPKPLDFCPRCECKRESRNLTTQKVVVVLVICVISGLSLYMLFLQLLAPLLQKANLYPHRRLRDAPATTSRLTDSAASSIPYRQRTASGQVTDVVNRARNQQERWTRAVEVQRQRVYNQRSLLQ